MLRGCSDRETPDEGRRFSAPLTTRNGSRSGRIFNVRFFAPRRGRDGRIGCVRLFVSAAGRSGSRKPVKIRAEGGTPFRGIGGTLCRAPFCDHRAFAHVIWPICGRQVNSHIGRGYRLQGSAARTGARQGPDNAVYVAAGGSAGNGTDTWCGEKGQKARVICASGPWPGGSLTSRSAGRSVGWRGRFPQAVRSAGAAPLWSAAKIPPPAAAP